MPAASRAISQLVTEKICRFGIASRPRYVNAVNAAPRCNSEQATNQQGRTRCARRHDAVKEQHHLRSFAQHGQSDDDRKCGERLCAFAHGIANPAHFVRDFATMARHPGVVPHQHDHRDTEDAGVEEFLTGALERIRDDAGKHRDDGCTQHATD